MVEAVVGAFMRAFPENHRAVWGFDLEVMSRVVSSLTMAEIEAAMRETDVLDLYYGEDSQLQPSEAMLPDAI